MTVGSGQAGLKPEQTGVPHPVRLVTQRCSLILTVMPWAPAPKPRPGVAVSDQVAVLQALADDGLRIDVEQKSPEENSVGFQLEDPKLGDAESAPASCQ